MNMRITSLYREEVLHQEIMVDSNGAYVDSVETNLGVRAKGVNATDMKVRFGDIRAFIPVKNRVEQFLGRADGTPSYTKQEMSLAVADHFSEAFGSQRVTLPSVSEIFLV